MILGRKKILERVKGENLIENFGMDSLGGAGYDLRVRRLHRLKSQGYIGINNRKAPDVEEISLTGDKYSLEPNEYILIETIEKVNMPENLLARVLPRSSVLRAGATVVTALVDPGYHGTLTFGMKNLSEFDFEFEKGCRIAQIVFEEVVGETELYSGKYQGGKVV